MALPTQKRSKSCQRTRQYQYRLKKICLSVCPKCKKPKLSHQVCPFCGTYMDKEIIKSKSKKDAKGKKQSEGKEKKKKNKKGEKKKITKIQETIK